MRFGVNAPLLIVTLLVAGSALAKPSGKSRKSKDSANDERPEIVVVVVDLKMPKICGPEVMESIRKQDANVKFIFVTGHGSEESFRACLDAGACDYLLKPVKIELLIEKVLEAAQA